MAMQHDTYEIKYTMRLAPAGMVPVPGQEMYQVSNDHTMHFSVWRAQKDTKDEIHRIKAIARALKKSDEFVNVRIVKKTEQQEEVSFE